jgi:glycosyltransferase involved in cell wall biosynthesis
MKISVVISTYSEKRCELVLECINSIKNQTMEPNEIIMVLDNDKDLVNFYKDRISGVTIINSGGFGLSKARNEGLLYSSSEIVVFLDDDIICEKDTLEKHFLNYHDSNVVGVGGAVLALWEAFRPIWFPEELDWIVGCSYKGMPKNNSSIRNPIGANMSFLRSVFLDVGLFEEKIGRIGNILIGSEEMELSIRIKKKLPNMKIIYDPECIVHHNVSNERSKFSYLIKRSFYEGLSKSLVRKQTKGLKLNVENSYLKFLLFDSILSRLSAKKVWKNILQIITIYTSIISVLIGYLYGFIYYE